MTSIATTASPAIAMRAIATSRGAMDIVVEKAITQATTDIDLVAGEAAVNIATIGTRARISVSG